MIKLKLLKNIIFSKIRNEPYKINLILTKRCNSKCSHCKIWKHKKNSEELQIKDYEQLFMNLPKSITWLSITGGEPTMRKELLGIIQTAIRKIPQLKLVSLISNGLNSKQLIEIVDYIKKQKGIIFYINLSLEGPEQIHNKIRKTKNSYQNTIETYKILKKKINKKENINLSFECTLMKDNLYHIIPFITNKEKYSIPKNSRFIFTIFHNSDYYLNQKIKKNITKKDIPKFDDLIKFLKSKNKFDPISIFQNKYLTNCKDYILTGKTKIKCSAIKDSLTISQDGKVYPCLMWEKEIGNLKKNNFNFNKIVHSQNSRNTRALILNGKCPNCWTPCEAYQSLISSYLF